MLSTRIRLVSAASLACGLVTAGCTTSGSDVTPTSSPSGRSTGSGAPASPSATPDFPSGSAAGSTGSTGGSTFKVSDALLGVEDLSGFTSTKVSATKSPLPCTPDEPSPSTTYPAAQRGEVAFTSSSGEARVDETIYVYDDDAEAEAEKFVAAGESGFDCSTGQLGGETVKIVPVADPPSAGVDVVRRWDLLFSDKTLGTAILARQGTVVVGLTFLATKTGSTEIDPTLTLNAAMAKVESAR